jgi:hypothetical protein
MSQENVEIVVGLFEAVNSRDFEAVRMWSLSFMEGFGLPAAKAPAARRPSVSGSVNGSGSSPWGSTP